MEKKNESKAARSVVEPIEKPRKTEVKKADVLRVAEYLANTGITADDVARFMYIQQGLNEVRAAEVTQVIELTDAIVKTKYENNPNTNAYTDTEKSKLAGIEAQATKDQTAAEIRDLLQTLTTTNRLDASAIKNLPTGGGGGTSLAPDIFTGPTAQGGASLVALRAGADPVEFTGDGANGWDIVLTADTHLLLFDFSGNSTTSNSNGEIVIRVDNSANGYPRKFVMDIVDDGPDQDTDEEARGHILKEVVAGNVTTLTVPNISGNYPNGFTAKFR